MVARCVPREDERRASSDDLVAEGRASGGKDAAGQEYGRRRRRSVFNEVGERSHDEANGSGLSLLSRARRRRMCGRSRDSDPPEREYEVWLEPPDGHSGSRGRGYGDGRYHGQLPFHGSLEATDIDTLAFPFLSVHLTGTGIATHLGNYTAIFDYRIDLRPPPTPAVGSFSLTGANGDSIFGDLVGRASIANGVATVVETATITGGTGRFTEATGKVTIARTVVQATGISSGSFDGTVIYTTDVLGRGGRVVNPLVGTQPDSDHLKLVGTDATSAPVGGSATRSVERDAGERSKLSRDESHRDVASISSLTARQAILTGWLLCGVLDITAACLQAWIQAGRTPAEVLRGVASALWGRSALQAGAGMAAIGLAMHFTVALTATLVFYRAQPAHGLSADRAAVDRRTALRRRRVLAMNYGTLPALSWVRSLYLHTPPRWPGSMSWPQLSIHMVCVGPPIAWGVRRARYGGSN